MSVAGGFVLQKSQKNIKNARKCTRQSILMQNNG
jgi:hypothetical protein